VFLFPGKLLSFFDKEIGIYFSGVNSTKFSFFGVKFFKFFNTKKWEKKPSVGSMCFYFWGKFLPTWQQIKFLCNSYKRFL
jgi:hypothetical protein